LAPAGTPKFLGTRGPEENKQQFPVITLGVDSVQVRSGDVDQEPVASAERVDVAIDFEHARSRERVLKQKERAVSSCQAVPSIVGVPNILVSHSKEFIETWAAREAKGEDTRRRHTRILPWSPRTSERRAISIEDSAEWDISTFSVKTHELLTTGKLLKTATSTGVLRPCLRVRTEDLIVKERDESSSDVDANSSAEEAFDCTTELSCWIDVLI
jgi:hypothetical protein